MFVLVDSHTKPNVAIGSLVMYTILTCICIISYFTRQKININLPLHLTTAAGLCGILNSALIIASINVASVLTSKGLQLAGLFYGLIIVPLTWMVGITFFSSPRRDKKMIRVILGHGTTLIQFVLSIVCVIFIAKSFSPQTTNELFHSTTTYVKLYVSTNIINWIYYLLFTMLAIEYCNSYARPIQITLILFLLLNTARLITETILLGVGQQLGIESYYYVMFFFTDFIASISLFVTTIFWRNLEN